MEVVEKHHTDRKRPHRRLRALAAPVILLVICTGFYWKLVLTNQYTWLESPDLATQVLPWLQVQAGEWHAGRVPLWDPYMHGGQSLIGQVQPGVASPLNWILFLAPLRHGWMRQAYVHWFYVLIHFLAAWFGYLLCRDLKRSQAASVAAGCVFALGGWMGTTNWPQMLNSALWAPLVFLYLLRCLRGERPLASAAASGAFFGMAWLGGHHQIPIFLLLATGGVWLYHIFRKAKPDWGAARLAAVFLIFIFLVGAFQTLPAYEYGKRSLRWVGANEPKGWNEPVPYSVHDQYSLVPTSLLAILIPGTNRHADPFIGVTALTLALLAVALAWKEYPVRLMAAVAAGGLLFSLGRNNVFHGILYALIPMVEKARNPSMAVFIYHFGIATLTSYGIDYLRSSYLSAWPRRAGVSLLVCGVVLFSILGGLALAGKPPGDDRFAVVALVALLLALLLRGWTKGLVSQPVAAVLILGLMLIEFGNTAGYGWLNREEKTRGTDLRALAQDSDLAAFLQSLPWPVRVDVGLKEIPYNFGDWYGIEQYGGYLASLSKAFADLPWHSTRGRQLFGVNYAIRAEPPEPHQREVFQSARGLKVYWNTDAYPRTWTVHEAEQLNDAQAIRVKLEDKSFDPRRTALLTEPRPALETCPEKDDVRLVKSNSGRLTIEADMGCRGMVILGDNYFPGWVATVDGKRAKIYEAYSVIRGVAVEGGKHTIEMRYRPASVIAGFFMSVAGILGALFLSIRARRAEAAAG
ncbi:MAG: YfhO family protein [Bryobacteraceae bacterium]